MLNIKSFGQKEFPLIKKKYSNFSLPCFYCSADSTELKTFLILTIGGMALCSMFFCLGLWLKGTFKNTETLSDLPLKIEDQENKEHKGYNDESRK